MSSVIDRLNAALEGRYRIERQLGEGGMATVYLAQDLRHKRNVAIKVLKPELAAMVGADRFLAEIETTANLQHPHILPLFDSGEVEGHLYYVMPWVEGESLRDRLDREKQLPVGEAVSMAVKVAGALQAAHDRGVIHRDIKPANILLQDGEPLVADFGIALALQEAGGGRLTETGLSLGTPFYMSPEQATADRDPDARSDQYSLACVLYEMLTGDPPHTGSTAQAVIAKILTRDPEPVTEARRSVPPNVESAVLKALERLPADRFPQVSDFGAALEGKGGYVAHTGAAASGRGGGPGDSSAVGPGAVGRSAGRFWPAATVLALALAALGWFRSGEEPAPGVPTQLAVLAPNLGGAATAADRQIAISPDGSTVLYAAIAPDGENRTLRRRLYETESVVLPGVQPFLAGYTFSPDGTEFVGYDVDDGRLYRYAIDGSNERRLPEDIPSFWGAWAPDGSLWMSDDVPDQGLVRVDRDGEISLPFGDRFGDFTIQQILPDGRTALAVRQASGVSTGPVLALDLEDGVETVLIGAEVSAARYTAGYLTYVLADGTLLAAELDLESLSVRGRPVEIAGGILVEAGIAQMDASVNGTVAYIPEAPRVLTLVDRDGSRRAATDQNRNYHAPAFSPDGRRIAVDFPTEEGRNVWVLSLEDGIPTRATFDRGGHDPQWTPDGRAVTYLADLPGGAGQGIGVFRSRPGSMNSEPLVSGVELSYTGVWLQDESALVVAAAGLGPDSRGDVGIARDGGRGPIEPLVATPFSEGWPAVSPDDRWLAYASDQSGRHEIYVRPLDREGDPVQVSLAGGIEPFWNPAGGELFYRTGAGSGSEMVAAAVLTEPDFRVVSRERLFPVSDMATATPHTNYSVSPDGNTFVMVRFNQESRIMIIQNLPELVNRITGGGGP